MLWDDESLVRTLDLAIASFTPVDDSGLSRPSDLLNLEHALRQDDEHAFLPEEVYPDVGKPSHGNLGTRAETLIRCEWNYHPGNSGFSKLVRVSLPDGRRVYIEAAMDWSKRGAFVLAATSGVGSVETDEQFLRLLYSTHGGAFGTEFMPGTAHISTALDIELLTDLYWIAGVDPEDDSDLEYEGWDNEDNEDDEAEDDEPRQITVPRWAADLYVVPDWPSPDERAAKHGELGAEYRDNPRAQHYAYSHWLDSLQPFIPDENRTEFEKRQIDERRNVIRKWLQWKASFA